MRKNSLLWRRLCVLVCDLRRHLAPSSRWLLERHSLRRIPVIVWYILHFCLIVLRVYLLLLPQDRKLRPPTKGASTNHKGIDWATPTGTTVVASNAGTVVHAGWDTSIFTLTNYLFFIYIVLYSVVLYTIFCLYQRVCLKNHSYQSAGQDRTDSIAGGADRPEWKYRPEYRTASAF